jgi:hypothetical protein
VLERAVQYGTLKWIDPWGERHLFDTTEAPFVTVRISDTDEPARLLSAPSLRAGEAYREGTVDVSMSKTGGRPANISMFQGHPGKDTDLRAL